MQTTVQMYFATNNILLIQNKSVKLWLKYENKLQWRSNDKAITEHGYRKISLLVSVSQINYLPHQSFQVFNLVKELISSPLTNLNILLNLVHK